MKYESLYRDFISLFPEDKSFFDNLCKDQSVDEEDGMHVVFGFVIVPYIRDIVKKNPDKTKKAFDFFEKMENCGEPKIAEVLEFSVLEDLLADDKELVSLYSSYFGEETAKAATKLMKWVKR